MTSGTVEQIVDEVVSIMKFAFTWGYRWRKPYSLMKSNKEVSAQNRKLGSVLMM